MKRFFRFLLVFVFCCGLLSTPVIASASGSCSRQSNGNTYRIVKEGAAPADNGWRTVSGSGCRARVCGNLCEALKQACGLSPSRSAACPQAPAEPCPNNDCAAAESAPRPAAEAGTGLWWSFLPAFTPVAQPTAEPVAPAAPASAPDRGDQDFAQAVVDLVNRERAAEGLSPLTWDADLAAAANLRVGEIQRSFSHTRPNGTSCFSALQEAGVSYRQAGENIALGQRTPEQVVNDWMNSPGHRANIMNSAYSRIGVGVAAASSGGYAWAQFFAN